jgi:hypothetical protein
LLAGLMQGQGERERDEALQSAGQRLAQSAQQRPPAVRKPQPGPLDNPESEDETPT